MSSRKFQEDIRRIVGLKDDGRKLDEQQARETIPTSRGVAYRTQSGQTGSGNSVPKDVEDSQKEEAVNGAAEDDGGLPDGLERSNKYCADGSLRPYSTGLCPEDTAGINGTGIVGTSYDNLTNSVNNGTAVDAITGLYDCNNGDPVRIFFDSSNTAAEGTTDAKELLLDENGLPLLDENGEAQYTNDQNDLACIPPPNWERCDCYQPEKRGGLKDGWDSVQAWHEAVNCIPTTGFTQNNTFYSADDYSSEPTLQFLSTVSTLIDWFGPLNGRSYRFVTQNGVQRGYHAGVGLPSGWDSGGWDFTYQNEDDYGGSAGLVTILHKKPPYLTIENSEICDQDYEPCENGGTDDESCNPLELLREEQCCEEKRYSDPNYFFRARQWTGTAFDLGDVVVDEFVATAAEANALVNLSFWSDTGEPVDIWGGYIGSNDYQSIGSNTSQPNYRRTEIYKCGIGNTGWDAAAIAYGATQCGQTHELCQVSDNAQDYTMSVDGIAPSPSDADIPPEQAETTAGKTFCNGSGDKVKVVSGKNGGQLVLELNPDGTTKGGDTAVHYYRDPTTGKMSFFGATEIKNYLPQ